MLKMTKAVIASAVLAVVCGNAAQAATVLDLAPTFPDVYVSNVAISYSVSGNKGTFTAQSRTTNPTSVGMYKPSSSVVSWQTITAPASPALMFDLSIAINTLTGQFIPNDPANHLFIKSSTQTYVSSTGATDFVMQGNDIFGFGFAEQSGALAAVGRKIVVQLNDPTGITQGVNTISNVASLSLTSGFTGNNAGYVDNFAVAVPLPNGMWMGLAGLAMVGGMTLMNRRKEVLAGR
jgi:hypothetical protein